jgi:hypothetical protein
MNASAQSFPASSVVPARGNFQEREMLKWALFFLVISLVAALFGFTGISAAAAEHSEDPIFHLRGDFRHPASDRLRRGFEVVLAHGIHDEGGLGVAEVA